MVNEARAAARLPRIRNGGHIHALTRDPVNDYGMDWLGLHYQETSRGGGGGPGGPGAAPPGAEFAPYDGDARSW